MKTKKQNNTKKGCLIALIVVLTLMGVLLIISRIGQVMATQHTVNQSNREPESTEPWKYTNPRVGVSVTLPSNWERNRDFVIPESTFEALSMSGMFSLIVFENLSNIDVQTMYSSFKDTIPKTIIGSSVTSSEITMINGQQYAYCVVDMIHTTEQMIFMATTHENEYIQFTFSTNEESFPADFFDILNSIELY